MIMRMVVHRIAVSSTKQMARQTTAVTTILTITILIVTIRQQLFINFKTYTDKFI